MFTDFFDGINAYAKALSIIKQMRLWHYAVVPAIISILLALGIGISAWSLSDDLGNFLVSWYSWEWGSSAISNISTVLGGVLVGLFGLIIFKYLVLILSSPFMSFLSEKVENDLTGNQQKNAFTLSGAIHDLVRGFRISMRNFTKEMFFTVLILLMGLVPFVGVLSPVLLFITQAYFIGFSNLDYTLERHFSISESTQFVKRHRFLAIGNGSIFLLLLMTGVGFLIAPPLATIAGTLESLERIKADKIIIPLKQDFV